MTELINDEIRVKIAELKGWKKEIDHIGTWYTFISPSGMKGYTSKNITKAIETAGVPNWPVDIAAAWELAIEAGLSVMKSKNGYIAGRFDLDQEYLDEELGIVDGHFSRGYAVSDTATRAICLAYIAWREAKG